MNEPAIGRRKRPYSAQTVGGEDRASSFSVSDAHSNSGVDPSTRAVANRHSQAVTVGDGNDTSCNDSADENDCDADDDRDVPEILELQSALAYLVSERDVKGIYNRGNKKDSTAKSNNAAATKTNQETHDEQLRRIPNLVNRILMEHYSTNQRTLVGGHATSMARKQKEKMTQLLLAVVVEFSEPYFARATRRRQRERKELLQLQEERKKQKPGGKKRAREEPQSVRASPQNDSSVFAFEDRAIAWATSCINQLLQPPAPVAVSSKRKGTAGGKRDCDSTADDPRIPELDALLATSGPHDGLQLEEQLQSALLQGLQARRRLQNRGT
ncbi:hypothetical protein ACHAXT_013069 [Thalassiosira profunda]